MADLSTYVLTPTIPLLLKVETGFPELRVYACEKAAVLMAYICKVSTAAAVVASPETTPVLAAV
jgi:hypothetical protein